MSIVVTGGRGMLARALQKLLPEARFLGRQELDITSRERCEEVLGELQPRLVYNLAAWTKVDDAEAHEAAATAANGEGAGHVARACRTLGARLIHVSTDYVFDGSNDRPWQEDDPTGPLSAYGRSKLRGEQGIEDATADALIVRTSWVYGDGGPNFVDTMLRLAGERPEIRVVNDQIGSPTYTRDLAEALVELAEGGFRGLVHYCGGGQTSWHGFAEHVLRRAGYTGKLVAIGSEELKRPAPRPAWSVLDTRRYTLWTGRRPRPWQEAADEFLELRLGLKANTQ